MLPPGDKALVDAAMTEAQPLNEDTMQADADEKAGKTIAVAGKEAGKISAEADAVAGAADAAADKAASNAPVETVNTAKTEEIASMPEPQIESEQNMLETNRVADDAATDDNQGAKPEASITEARVPDAAAVDAVASTSEAAALVGAGPATQEQVPASSELPAAMPAETLPEADTKAGTVKLASDSAVQGDALSNDVGQTVEQSSDSQIIPMDEDNV